MPQRRHVASKTADACGVRRGAAPGNKRYPEATLQIDNKETALEAASSQSNRAGAGMSQPTPLDIEMPNSDYVACPGCDLMFDIGHLTDGESASCDRCGTFLSTVKADELDRVAAYCVASLVLLVVAFAFPFMKFSRAGLENTMTLPQTVAELWINGMPELAVVVAGFIIFIPALVMTLVLVLAVTLKSQRHTPWLKGLGGLVFHLQSWCMAEVFFVGVLVSVVKIAKMATIVLGISFWAYAAFTILFTLAITNLDKYQCWRRIEAVSHG